MLRHFTLAVLMSLVLVLPGQIAAAEDDNEPPVSQSENDPAFTDKQPVDPVAIEKMAADVRQVPLTEDMINRFIASFKGMREVAKKFPNTKLPDSVIDEAPGSEFKHMPEDKRAAMTAVATANGFKDLEEWSVVGSSIAMSYTYALQGSLASFRRPSACISPRSRTTPSSTPSRRKSRLRDWRILGRSLVDWSLCRRITLWSSR
jgi:hypothetical protein